MNFYVKFHIKKDAEKKHVYVVVYWDFDHIVKLAYDYNYPVIPDKYIDYEYLNKDILSKYPFIFNIIITKQLRGRSDVDFIRKYLDVKLSNSYDEYNLDMLDNSGDNGQYIFVHCNNKRLSPHAWICFKISIVEAVNHYIRQYILDTVEKLLNSYADGKLDIVKNFAEDLSKFIFTSAEKYLSDLLQFVNNEPYEKSGKVDSFSEEFMDKYGNKLAETTMIRDSQKKLKSA
jgi:hypothetical protein